MLNCHGQLILNNTYCWYKLLQKLTYILLVEMEEMEICENTVLDIITDGEVKPTFYHKDKGQPSSKSWRRLWASVKASVFPSYKKALF